MVLMNGIKRVKENKLQTKVKMMTKSTLFSKIMIPITPLYILTFWTAPIR